MPQAQRGFEQGVKKTVRWTVFSPRLAISIRIYKTAKRCWEHSILNYHCNSSDFLFAKFKKCSVGAAVLQNNFYVILSAGEESLCLFKPRDSSELKFLRMTYFYLHALCNSSVFLFSQTFHFLPKVAVFGCFCISCSNFSSFFSKIHLAQIILPWYNSAVCVLGSITLFYHCLLHISFL